MEKTNKKHRWREILSDCLMVGGGAAVSFGIGLLHIAAGIIAGGVLAIVYGLLIGMGGDVK